MRDDAFPVKWLGRQAIVAFPDHIDVSNAGQLREQLLSVINRGAAVLIADMTVTASCDHAGVDAVARAYQRALVSGTQLTLVVTAPLVRRVLSINGLDRLVSIYPSLEAAIAAGVPGTEPLTLAPARAQANGHQPARPTAITPGVLWQLIDALGDGLVLTGDDGEIVLANQRVAEMFGYEQAELIGRPVESLVPADLREAHRTYRASRTRGLRGRGRWADGPAWPGCATMGAPSRWRSASARCQQRAAISFSR